MRSNIRSDHSVISLCKAYSSGAFISYTNLIASSHDHVVLHLHARWRLLGLSVLFEFPSNVIALISSSISSAVLSFLSGGLKCEENLKLSAYNNVVPNQLCGKKEETIRRPARKHRRQTKEKMQFYLDTDDSNTL